MRQFSIKTCLEILFVIDACSLEREKNQKSFANVKVENWPNAHPEKTDPVRSLFIEALKLFLAIEGIVQSYA